MPSKGSPNPDATLRALRALAAWQRTHSYEQAAKEAGYGSRGAAHHAIQRELDRVRSATVEDLRASIMADYMAMRAAILPRALGDPNAPDPDLDVDDADTIKEKLAAKRPNLWAVDRVNEILRDVRKMMGVDVQQSVITIPPNIVIQDSVAQAIDGPVIVSADPPKAGE